VDDGDKETLAGLLYARRWGALGSARDGEPLASWVAFVAEEPLTGFLMHLSRLALHTRYLLDNRQASLAVSEADADPARDPQTLARVSVQGTVEWLERDTPAWEQAQARYLSRLPQAEPLFGFADFHLCRLVPQWARFVPGLGRAHRLDAGQLRALSPVLHSGEWS
jgi:putative heme iron utilization protein